MEIVKKGRRKLLFSFRTFILSLYKFNSRRIRIHLTKYRVARNFCGSLFLRIDDFLCIAGTNFCNLDRLVILAGN